MASKKEKINKRIFTRKDFINLDYEESDASIWSEIVLKDDVENEGKLYDSIGLKIRDCNTVIYLTLQCIDEEGYKNSVYKIDKLITHLTEFKENLALAHEEAKELQTLLDKKQNGK